jgi:hypothetical protein
MDLLTVVMHELGHALGLDHQPGDGVMAETLAPGVRRLLDPEPSTRPFPGLTSAFVTDGSIPNSESAATTALAPTIDSILDRRTDPFALLKSQALSPTDFESFRDSPFPAENAGGGAAFPQASDLLTFDGLTIPRVRTDPDGDPLAVTNLTTPINGTVTDTPHSGFLGTDTFTHQANASSNVATVTVPVVSRPRMATNDSGYAFRDGSATYRFRPTTPTRMETS